MNQQQANNGAQAPLNEPPVEGAPAEEEKQVQEQVQVDSPKMVEIKHTRSMKDASGNDVEVVDYTDNISTTRRLR